MFIERDHNENMADEIYLPVEIIQRIQSCLNGKQAAQTALISKSWHDAWSTHQTLYLDENCFTYSEDFLNFAKKTVRRYEDSKLYVNELVLILAQNLCYNNKSKILCCENLIKSALNLCVKGRGLTIESKWDYSRYVLPEPLYVTSSLTKFHVSNCKIKSSKALFPRLKSLVLHNVYVTDEILHDVLSGCPLLEDLLLLLSFEGRLRKVNVSKMQNLVNLRVTCWIDVEFEDPGFGLGVAEFRYLRTLELHKVEQEFFTTFSSRFPCVEKLCIESVHCGDVEISSRSLRDLSMIYCMGIRRIKLDVPNIARFVFHSTYNIPFVSFAGTASRNCVSEVKFAINYNIIIEDSWFEELRKFLTDLSPSRISLHIKFCAECNVLAERIPFFPIPVVENLSVEASRNLLTSPITWQGLFSSCHPRFITICMSLTKKKKKKGHKSFIQRDVYELLRDDLFHRMYKLEDVNLELFDKNLMEWQTIPLETLRDILIKKQETKIRFRFNWGKESFPV